VKFVCWAFERKKKWTITVCIQYKVEVQYKVEIKKVIDTIERLIAMVEPIERSTVVVVVVDVGEWLRRFVE